MTNPWQFNFDDGFDCIEDLSDESISHLSRHHDLPGLGEAISSAKHGSDFVIPRAVRRYLNEALLNGHFELISPVSGKAQKSIFSIILQDKTTFVVFDDFIVGIGHLGLGFPIMALIVPSRKIFIKIMNDFWGVQEAHLQKLGIILQGISDEDSRDATVWLVSGDANFAHNAWNQLSTLQAISRSELAINKAVLVNTHEPLGDARTLFPELAHWEVRDVTSWTLEDINRPGRLVLPVGGNQVPADLVEKILFAVGEDAGSDCFRHAKDQLRVSDGPLLWLSIRTRNRTAINQEDMLSKIALRFLTEYSGSRIILDGHSYMEDVEANPGYNLPDQRSVVLDDRATASAITERLEAAGITKDRVIEAIGCSIRESIHLAQTADFYFCHHGTVQHKIGWFSACNGVVHCNRRTIETFPALYVRDQSELASLPAYLPADLIASSDPGASETDLERVLKTENYVFADADAVTNFIFEEMEKLNLPGRRGPELNDRHGCATDSKATSPKVEMGLTDAAANSSRITVFGMIKKIISIVSSRAQLRRLVVRRVRSILSPGIVGEVKFSREFDWEFYASAYTDVPLDEGGALNHFSTVGLVQGRFPSSRFDPVEYALKYPEVGGRANAFLHFIRFGKNENRDRGVVDQSFDFKAAMALIKGSSLFDAEQYAARVPVVAEQRWNPLAHYLMIGARHYIEPVSLESMNRYVARYPDIRAAKLNPLLHWLAWGANESRTMPTVTDQFRWVDANWSFNLPDDIVHQEIMIGHSFFASFDFSFVNRSQIGLRKQCAAWLARQQPVSLSRDQKPVVSVIIPVYGQIDYVFNCLHSLLGHLSYNSFEIIVCDDASPDSDEVQLVQQIPWVRYIRKEKNGGFIDCCNFAATQAQGEIFVFLNSDTRVVSGWLDNLVHGFKELGAGVVGSKLLNSDATLQEAGGIIFKDGSAHNYGRNDHSSDPRYCYSRPVDYISGASLAVRADIWQSLGGFDVHYAPAYCEDVDLAFRAREKGHEVWYQPYSRVIHYEGVTHGRDVTRGVKSYQIDNLRKFFERHRAQIATHADIHLSPHEAALHAQKNRMLVIDALVPAPDQDSGSVMTSEVMRTFRDLGYSQHFLATHHPVWDEKYTVNLQKAGVCCHYHPFSFDVPAIASITKKFDLSLIYRHEVASKVYDDLRKLMQITPIIFANVDLHYLRESRGAEISGDKRALALSEITKSSELKMFAQADASFVHTPIERELILSELPAKIDNIIVFPWLAEAVDSPAGFSERLDLMFLGNFPHTPNVDSILYFMESIWPHVEKRLPENAKLLIVGNKPNRDVLALASSRVVVTGFVDDLSPYFARSKVFVAPLRYGAGIKGKIVNAFAHGVPSVATKVAAEGIAEDGDAHVIVQDDPVLFADEIIRLYTDSDHWHSVQREGLAFLERSYSRARAEALCREAANVAMEVWTRRQQFTRAKDLRRIMENQGHVLGDRGISG